MKRYLLLLLAASNFAVAGNSERYDLAINEIEALAPAVPAPVAAQLRVRISNLERTIIILGGIGGVLAGIYALNDFLLPTPRFIGNTTYRATRGIMGLACICMCGHELYNLATQ